MSSKKEIKYSFIVPIYKVEDYLIECVKSILKQSLDNFEVILVDDGSPDNCPRMCDELAKKDSRIKTIHQKNKGLSAARNTGMKAANGKYYLFVDPDDYLEDDYLKIIDKNIDDYDLLIFGYYDLYKNKRIIRSGENVILSKDEALPYLISGDNYCGFAWNKVYKREIAEKFNIYFDEDVATCEDVLYAYEYINKIDTVKVIGDAIINYRQRKSSIISKKVSEINSKPLFDTYKYFIEDTNNKDFQKKSKALYLKYYYKHRKYIDKKFIDCRLLEDIRDNDYKTFSNGDKILINIFRYTPAMRSFLYWLRGISLRKYD